jgi:hypothetical protein
MATLASTFPLFFVETKQAYKAGLRSHFVSTWNVVAALVLVSLAITVVLAEVPNAASASVFVLTLRSFGALFMWLNVFYYMRGFRRTGPYVRTILEVFNDMLGFLVLYKTPLRDGQRQRRRGACRANSLGWVRRYAFWMR